MTVRSISDDSPTNAKSLALVHETVALRRCTLFRDAIKGIAISYPAALVGCNTLATWVRRHGVTVDVTSAVELNGVLADFIDPKHIVMHSHVGAAAPIRRAVNAGAARFVVGSSTQIAVLADSADRPRRVIIDATDAGSDALASDVLSRDGLELIGLHRRLNDPDDAIGMEALRAMIEEMARIRREYGVFSPGSVLPA